MRFEAGARLLHETKGVLEIESSRRHHGALLVKFTGVDTRDRAEELRGTLFVGAEDLRTLDTGEYWHHDVIGCAVVDETGAELGAVTRVDPGVAQDLFAIETPLGERLVPAVKDIVVEVDIRGRRIVIAPPAGLLD
jgi:16S rRNA processing protein RimM